MMFCVHFHSHSFDGYLEHFFDSYFLMLCSDFSIISLDYNNKYYSIISMASRSHDCFIVVDLDVFFAMKNHGLD